MEERNELIKKCSIRNNFEIAGFFEEYRFLSNFHTCNVIYNGKLFPSSEHAFMYAKLDEDEHGGQYSQMIKLSAAEVKKWGRTIDLRKDWEEIKKKVMFDVNFAKYSQNEDLKEKLLSTGEKTLSELNWWNDKFYGVDYKTGEGKNVLGKVLMMIRFLLQK